MFFGVNGLGKDFVEAIQDRDYTMIMGTTLFFAALVALANVLVDISYGFSIPEFAIGNEAFHGNYFI